MKINWQRGLTRLYLLAWALWVVAIGVKVLSHLPYAFHWLQVCVVIFVAFVIPALLLLALRWIARGFLGANISRP